MKFWPVLVDFTITSHLLFSNHVTIVVNFEKFLFHLISYKILGKVTKFQRLRSKALRVMAKKLKGSPGPNRVTVAVVDADSTDRK